MARLFPVLPPLRTGPLPRIQWVVELVGPRSVAAADALRLLDPDWKGILGQPIVWAMAARDDRWQELLGHSATSFDSLALSWDLVDPRGSLTRTAAETLLARAAEFGEAVGRRALPLWPADETESRAKAAMRLTERLDGGFAVSAAFPLPRSEPELLAWLASEGFDSPDGEGGLEWRRPGHPAFLTATPTGEPFAFGFGTPVEGVTFGARVPLCPAPVEALEAAFDLTRSLVERYGGGRFDGEGEPLDERRMRAELAGIVESMSRAKLEPGGAECRRLFR